MKGYLSRAGASGVFSKGCPARGACSASAAASGSPFSSVHELLEDVMSIVVLCRSTCGGICIGDQRNGWAEPTSGCVDVGNQLDTCNLGR